MITNAEVILNGQIFNGTLSIENPNLSLQIGEIQFEGTDFDSLTISSPPEQPSIPFPLNGTILCDCIIRFIMEILSENNGIEQKSSLGVEIELGKPLKNGGISHEAVQLRFISEEIEIQSKKYDSFESAFNDLIYKMPPQETLKICYTCAYSDYHPGGSGLFGSMACFRNTKDAYFEIKKKEEIMNLWAKKTEMVQETHYCTEFLARKPGTGYRGY